MNDETRQSSFLLWLGGGGGERPIPSLMLTPLDLLSQLV